MPSDLNGHIERVLVLHDAESIIALLRRIKANGWPECERLSADALESLGAECCQGGNPACAAKCITQTKAEELRRLGCRTCPPCRFNQLVSEKGERNGSD